MAALNVIANVQKFLILICVKQNAILKARQEFLNPSMNMIVQHAPVPVMSLTSMHAVKNVNQKTWIIPHS